MKAYNEFYVSLESEEIVGIELERMCSRLVIKDSNGNFYCQVKKVC